MTDWPAKRNPSWQCIEWNVDRKSLRHASIYGQRNILEEYGLDEILLLRILSNGCVYAAM